VSERNSLFDRVKMWPRKSNVTLVGLVASVMLALGGSYLFTRCPSTAKTIEEKEVGFLLNALLLLVIVYGIVILERPPAWRAYLGLATFDWRGVLYGFLLFILLTVVTRILLDRFILNFTSQFLSNLGMTQSASFYEAYRLPLVLVLLPVAEELFFRGYLQNRLQELLSPNKGLLVATVIWAAWHVWAPQEFVRRLLAGLCVEGLLFRWRQNTWPPLIVHASRVTLRAMLG
jgi:membrane protease YdiL (CAAX protease family)